MRWNAGWMGYNGDPAHWIAVAGGPRFQCDSYSPLWYDEEWHHITSSTPRAEWFDQWFEVADSRQTGDSYVVFWPFAEDFEYAPWPRETWLEVDNIIVVASSETTNPQEVPTCLRRVVSTPTGAAVLVALSDAVSPSGKRTLIGSVLRSPCVAAISERMTYWHSYVICDTDAVLVLGLTCLPSGRLVVTYVIDGAPTFRTSDGGGEEGTWSAPQAFAGDPDALGSARDNRIAWKVRT